MAKAKKKAAKKAAVRKPAAKKAAPKVQPAIQPYLCVKDPASALAFYEKAFGFKIHSKFAGPDGKIQHVEIEHGNGRVMLGPECPNSPYRAPSTIGGTSVTLYVYVNQVDEVTASAKAAGGIVVQEPEDKFWGDRISTVVDPEGHRWCLATHLRDVTEAELRQAMTRMQPEPAAQGASH